VDEPVLQDDPEQEREPREDQENCMAEKTRPSPLVDEVLANAAQNVTEEEQVLATFGCFLVPEASVVARFIIGLSPWNACCQHPHIRLCFVTGVAVSLWSTDRTDLSSGFFQLLMRQDRRRFYGKTSICYCSLKANMKFSNEVYIAPLNTYTTS
jgi:hypothetical protein